MKTVRRLLHGEISRAVSFVLAGFLALFLFFDVVDELQNLANLAVQGSKLHHALLFVAFKIPSHIYELLPISVLIGSVFAPLFGVVLVDHFILRRRRADLAPRVALRWDTLLAWACGAAAAAASLVAWGKLTRDKSGQLIGEHPLLDHMTDVAACFLALAGCAGIRRSLELAAGRPLDEADLQRLAVLVFLHDVGKANATLQQIAELTASGCQIVRVAVPSALSGAQPQQALPAPHACAP